MSKVRILSIRTVCDRLGISRSTLWRLVRDGDFPRSIKLSTNRVGFDEQEIDAWIAQRAAQRPRAL